MKAGMTLFSLAALGTLIGVSVWASMQIGLPESVNDLIANPGAGNNPWLWATLADAYFGFLWFWLWVAYKETGNAVRLLWLLLILGLGNMAMAAYMLLQLRRLPPGAGIEQLLLRKA